MHNFALIFDDYKKVEFTILAVFKTEEDAIMGFNLAKYANPHLIIRVQQIDAEDFGRYSRKIGLVQK